MGFSAWAATSIGNMALLGLMLPCLAWSLAMLGEYTSDLKLGFWLILAGAILSGGASALGLYSLPLEPMPESIKRDAKNVQGSAASVIAMLVGLALIVAFFMPWMAGGGESLNGYDFLEQESGGDHFLGNLLFDLITGGSLLAGIGSLYYGIRLAMDLSALQPRGVVFRTRMTTGIGSMAILAAFWPCFVWASYLLAEETILLKVGFWISIGGAALLVVAALIGLTSIAAIQQEPGVEDEPDEPLVEAEPPQPI